MTSRLTLYFFIYLSFSRRQKYSDRLILHNNVPLKCCIRFTSCLDTALGGTQRSDWSTVTPSLSKCFCKRCWRPAGTLRGGANRCQSTCHSVFARNKRNLHRVLIQSSGANWDFAPPPPSLGTWLHCLNAK